MFQHEMTLMRIKTLKLTESMKKDVPQLMNQQKSMLTFKSLQLLEQTDKRAAGQRQWGNVNLSLCALLHTKAWWPLTSFDQLQQLW